MTHRPYPSVDRALRQLNRHEQPAPAVPIAECLRPMAEALDRLREAAFDRAMDGPMWLPGLKVAAPPVDEYRLSTRGPVVSGGS